MSLITVRTITQFLGLSSIELNQPKQKLPVCFGKPNNSLEN